MRFLSRLFPSFLFSSFLFFFSVFFFFYVSIGRSMKESEKRKKTRRDETRRDDDDDDDTILTFPTLHFYIVIYEQRTRDSFIDDDCNAPLDKGSYIHYIVVFAIITYTYKYIIFTNYKYTRQMIWIKRNYIVGGMLESGRPSWREERPEENERKS